MRALLIVATLLCPAVLSAPTSAQGRAGQDATNADPVDLAAHCVQMRKGRSSSANTPDTKKLMAQCAELDRKAASSRRR